VLPKLPIGHWQGGSVTASVTPGVWPYVGAVLGADEPSQLPPARQQVAFILAFHIVLVAFTAMMLIANYRGIIGQKTVAQSRLMLTTVQPLLPASSRACSAPAV
jgi:hypothetical protein